MLLDTLDLTGDWKLTYGFEIGFTTDTHPAQHLVPKQARDTYLVHFDRDRDTPATPGLPAFEATPDGLPATQATPDSIRYKGFYHKTNPPHHPRSEMPGSLIAEIWYAFRGVFVVQIIDRTVELYIAVLSGYHQHYPTDLGFVQIAGGWADVGEAASPADTTVVTRSNKGNFTLVKV